MYISIWLGVPFVLKEIDEGKIGLVESLVLAQMACIVVGSLVLNFYWFYLMIKMIARVLGRMICPKKESEDIIELVNADSLKEAGNYNGSSDEHGKEEKSKAERKVDKCAELGGLEC